MQERAFGPVPREGRQGVEVAEAEFANVDHFGAGEGDGVGAEIPRFHFVRAHLHATEVAHTGNFGLVLCHAAAGAEFFDFLLA